MIQFYFCFKLLDITNIDRMESTTPMLRYDVRKGAHVVNGNDSKRFKSYRSATFTDLSDQSYEIAFSFLGFHQLTEMACVCKRFRRIARYVFQKNFTDKWVTFNPMLATDDTFLAFVNSLLIFSDKIRKLNITFYSNSRLRNHMILDRIMEFCHGSVNELHITKIPCDMVIHPFEKIQKLMVADSYLSPSMANLICNASKLQSLEMFSVENVFDGQLVDKNFPLLKHFANYNQVITDSQLDNLNKFRRFISANQQLTSFGLGVQELEMLIRYREMHQQFFRAIEPYVPFPDEINYIPYLVPFEPLYSGDMKCLHLPLGYSADFFKCMRQNEIIIERLPLKQLELYIAEFPMYAMDFFVQCRNLVKCQVYFCEEIDVESTAALALNLPELIEFGVFLLYDVDIKTTRMPAIMRVIVNNNIRLKKLTLGFRIGRPEDGLTQEKMARKYQPCLADLFQEHFPIEWNVEFQSEIIQVDRQYSRFEFVLKAILTTQ